MVPIADTRSPTLTHVNLLWLLRSRWRPGLFNLPRPSQISFCILDIGVAVLGHDGSNISIAAPNPGTLESLVVTNLSPRDEYDEYLNSRNFTPKL